VLAISAPIAAAIVDPRYRHQIRRLFRMEAARGIAFAAAAAIPSGDRGRPQGAPTYRESGIDPSVCQPDAVTRIVVKLGSAGSGSTMPAFSPLRR
jgi:hypothetical protein